MMGGSRDSGARSFSLQARTDRGGHGNAVMRTGSHCMWTSRQHNRALNPQTGRRDLPFR
jgi:hypothetical protein